ncbi:MAG: CapA family protein, partial [Salinimicrobium sp.]
MRPLQKMRSGFLLAFLLLLLPLTDLSAMQNQTLVNAQQKEKSLKLFLAGDVMLGRGIDQAMKVSVDPVLYEAYIKDARDYIKLAERKNGKLHLPLAYEHIWGDALKVWNKEAPQLKFINLETAVTTSSDAWPGKGIHYRMHPQNVKSLTAAGIDHVSLANNHVLDWGRSGLLETINSLKNCGIKFSGAGKNAEAAQKPAVLPLKNARILIFSYGSPSSGIPAAWAAEADKSGVNYLPNLDEKELSKLRRSIQNFEKPGDLIIFSVHWGGNWGYKISEDKKVFAHRLIDEAGIDLVFGHSSHHPLGIEVYKNKLILYGAGDFFNDYEG